MKKQKSIILVGGLVLLAILIAVAVSMKEPAEQVVSTDAPVDVVVDFYRQWKEELKSPDTDPYASGLSKSLLLSPELRKKIKSAKGYSGDELDPVLCQTTPDIEIATRRVYEQEDEVQILVTARDKTLTGQATVTLRKYNEGWYMDDIKCSPGEFGEDREFTFEQEGFLLKGSTLETLDPELWYLIFEEDGQPGHYAPLMFSAESKCLNKKGKGDVCVPDQFTDVTKISVQGQMTESGVEVVNIIEG